MKRTKKMIMIPMAEYDALITQLRSEKDPLKSEKSEVEQKISKTLNDNKIDANVKRKKVDWLKKQRKQLKGQIDNRTQKVVIAQPTVNGAARLSQANIAPYLGVSQPIQQEVHQQTAKFETPAKKEEEPDFESAFSGDPSAVAKTGLRIRRTRRHPLSVDSPSQPIISPQHSKALHDYVSVNKEKFRIKEDGRFEMNTHNIVRDSDYKAVLNYLLGKEEKIPKGSLFLANRLLKDDKIKEWQSQEGKGKKRRRVVVRLDAIKTKPFVFRPKIWEKLG